jgi:hypothetical protein
MNPIVDRILEAVTLFPALGAAFLSLTDALRSAKDKVLTDQLSLALAETEFEEACARMATASLKEVLASCAPTASEVEVEGRRYRRMAEPSRGVYYGLRGPVELQRHLYRELGVHNGATVVPLELVAGIVDGRWTPLAAVAAAHLLQDEPSRDALETCKVLKVLPYSRCSLERGGQWTGEEWEKIRENGEEHLATTFEIPTKATSLAASVDRVALPMEEPRGKDEKGNDKIEVVYRMAYCAIWTLYDADGEALHSTRYGRMPAEGHENLEETLRGDVEALLRQRPDLRVIGLADGAPEMQLMLDRVLQEVTVESSANIDFWHVIEKLAAAGTAAGRPPEWVDKFKSWLKEQEDGAERVEEELQIWADAYGNKPLPEALETAQTYMARNRERMRYKKLLDASLPIGSGPVEATCKTLVTTRMKRSGARWKTPGGQAVLSLRSLARSSRWEPAMKYLLTSLKKTVHAVSTTT